MVVNSINNCEGSTQTRDTTLCKTYLKTTKDINHHLHSKNNNLSSMYNKISQVTFNSNKMCLPQFRILQIQIGQLATIVNQLQSKGSGQIPSQTIIRPQVNATSKTAKGKATQTIINAPDIDNSTRCIPLPFPRRVVQARKSEIDDELLQTFSKFHKELCINKRKKLKGDVEVGRNVYALIKSEQVLTLIQPAMPKKCSDLGTFSISYTIGKCNFDVMLDLGTSINVMPSSLYKSLRLGALEPTSVVIQLAKQEHCTSTWHFGRYVGAIDFYVLYMKDELSSKGPKLILGRPFLKTTRTNIDVHARTHFMEFGDNRVEYNIFEAMKHPIENHLVFYLDVIDQLGHDYINLHYEFPDFDYFTNCDCTCTRLNECPICTKISSAINVEQKERLFQSLKKLRDFYEHLVKHSTSNRGHAPIVSIKDLLEEETLCLGMEGIKKVMPMEKDHCLLTPYNLHLCCEPSFFEGVKQAMKRLGNGIHGEQDFVSKNLKLYEDFIVEHSLYMLEHDRLDISSLDVGNGNRSHLQLRLEASQPDEANSAMPTPLLVVRCRLCSRMPTLVRPTLDAYSHLFGSLLASKTKSALVNSNTWTIGN
ncbi:hypothetical protein CR513_13280, partial [Mucuna pruriens]